MTLGELLVLSFLALHPRPVCTAAYPQGIVTDEISCPRNDISNVGGFFDGMPCIRRFRA